MDTELKAHLDRIDAMLVELNAAQRQAAKVILSTAEARVLAGFESASAFYRWAETWGVANSGPGRWPRHRIEAGLAKEARSQPRARGQADRRQEAGV